MKMCAMFSASEQCQKRHIWYVCQMSFFSIASHIYVMFCATPLRTQSWLHWQALALTATISLVGIPLLADFFYIFKKNFSSNNYVKVT